MCVKPLRNEDSHRRLLSGRPDTSFVKIFADGVGCKRTQVCSCRETIKHSNQIVWLFLISILFYVLCYIWTCIILCWHISVVKLNTFYCMLTADIFLLLNFSIHYILKYFLLNFSAHHILTTVKLQHTCWHLTYLYC